MGTETLTKATPRVVKLEKGLKLAEAWVNNMSESTSGEPSQIESVDRPSRLGLGARVIGPPRSAAASADPAERKLLGKLKASKRNQERENTVEEGESSEEDGDEPESRAKAFVKKKKKRSVPWATSSQPNKK